MNKDRRARLKHTLDALEAALDELECLQEEEQDALDNLPENLKESERASQMDFNIEEIEDAVRDIRCSLENLQNLIED